MFDIAGHILHLLQTEGATAIDAVKTAITGIEAVRSGNYAAIWDALNKEQADAKEIADAIRAEFGVN